MSQSSPSTRTLSPGSTPDPDSEYGDGNTQDDDDSSPSTNERSDDGSLSTIANALITELKDLCIRNEHEYDHDDTDLQGQLFSLDSEQQDVDSRDSIQYVHGFPVWKPFALYSSTGQDGVRFTVSICPTLEARFAVPVILAITEDSTTLPFALSLWDHFEIRHCNGVAPAELRSRMSACLNLWVKVMQLLIDRTTDSLNEMLGTLVLRRSMARCYSLYQTMVDLRDAAEDDEYILARDHFVEVFHLWCRDLRNLAENPDTVHFWSTAIDIVGY
ncbi:hypothetical protein V8E54_000186 [Elaphomyces granulatus]